MGSALAIQHPAGLRRARIILVVTLALVTAGLGLHAWAWFDDAILEAKCYRYDVSDLVGAGHPFSDPEPLIASLQAELAPDGRRFVIFGVHPEQSTRGLSVYGNWFAQQRVLAALDRRAGRSVERPRF